MRNATHVPARLEEGEYKLLLRLPSVILITYDFKNWISYII